MPTVRQLFALLREDVEQEAIEETRKQNGKHFEQHMCSEVAELDPPIWEAIASSFYWDESSKGHEYWSDIANNPPLKTQQDA